MTKDAKRQAAASQPFFVMMPEQIAGDDEISIFDLCRTLADSRWIILFITLIFTCAAIIYALQLTPIYQAEVLVAPAQKNEQSISLGGLASRFEGLASLAGVSLPVSSDIETALAILKSRRFISGFVDQHNLKPILFSDSWDPERKIWNIAKPSTVARIRTQILGDEKRETSEQLNLGEPSMWSTYNKFVNNILTVTENKKSGLLTIQVNWGDPTLASEWANALVYRLNSELRQQVISESERGIEYLKAQIHETSLADLRAVLYRIIEDHTKNITLAKVNEQYALKVIDPAVPPHERIKPNRTKIVFFGFVMGFLTGVFVAVLRLVIQRARSSPEEESPEQGNFQFR